MTTGTNTYDVVEHLVGWIVDGVEYAPGQSITVSGQMTATPVIGEQSRTLKSSEVRNGTKVEYIDVSDGTETIQGGESTKNQNDSRNKYNRPSGYNWFNSSNPDDGTSVSEVIKIKSETWS